MKQVWLRHKNGNGKKYGNDCEVSDDSYLDRLSSVGDRAQVFNAIIRNSCLSDDVLVAGYPNPIEITDCELSGNARVWQCPKLCDVTLENVSVFGDAVLKGPWALRDFVRIHSGIWTRPPRYSVIQGGSIRVVISECVPGFGHIGCWCRSYEEWFRKGYRQMLGLHAGWTEEMIEATYQAFKGWAA